MSELFEIPARSSAHVALARGRRVRVINTHGSQVVDTWAFDAAEPALHMSLEHGRVSSGRAIPKVGDMFTDQRRAPLLAFTADTSGGAHDTLCAACDIHRYRSLGHEGPHDNCADNLQAELARLGVLEAAPAYRDRPPPPLNLFQNAPVSADGAMTIIAPISPPGGYVELRAERDLTLVFSACPMDLTDTNGAARRPVEAHFMVLD